MNDPRIKIDLDMPSQDQEGNARESANLKINRPVHAIKCYSMATADEGLPSRYSTEDEPKTRPMPTDVGNGLPMHFGTPDSTEIEMPRQGVE